VRKQSAGNFKKFISFLDENAVNSLAFVDYAKERFLSGCGMESAIMSG
jgi:hypothetical protein